MAMPIRMGQLDASGLLFNARPWKIDLIFLTQGLFTPPSQVSTVRQQISYYLMAGTIMQAQVAGVRELRGQFNQNDLLEALRSAELTESVGAHRTMLLLVPAAPATVARDMLKTFKSSINPPQLNPAASSRSDAAGIINRFQNGGAAVEAVVVAAVVVAVVAVEVVVDAVAVAVVAVVDVAVVLLAWTLTPTTTSTTPSHLAAMIRTMKMMMILISILTTMTICRLFQSVYVSKVEVGQWEVGRHSYIWLNQYTIVHWWKCTVWFEVKEIVRSAQLDTMNRYASRDYYFKKLY